ncbi:endonuclease VII domain-containing protein [Nonomuraea sp. 3-1Str]|uniref:endonuclease domain-containing protein n=1 Tax=Nonomuraea sp. 3-1Str TaxID=2929801 RepID=UPI00285F831D|nr:endonuclease domain-containing protein [Nonomuraea sp. 3-1Str]MDR8415068.1 endonuclease VII domain-containing protein [Nonomuraea sp. 3-1Str]
MQQHVHVADGQLIAPPEVPVPRIWLPLAAGIVAELPPVPGTKRWLKRSAGIRAPQFGDDKKWRLPRSSLGRLIIVCIDRYGYAAVWRDMAKLSTCNRLCLEATGDECDCSCLAANHGQNSPGWHQMSGHTVVADHGEYTRSLVLYTPAGVHGGARIYAGELDGVPYTAERRRRRDWPKAAAFVCAACMTNRAQVWDHCHAHGYVRAPLCNGCNTRHWTGWHVSQGRAERPVNVDPSYYQRCPRLGDPYGNECSK